MPLQTDLLNYSGRFLTQGSTQFQRYTWENISEYGVPDNLNTFSVEIKPSGYIGMHYEKINISPWRPITIGMTGDTSQGEYTQHYHGAGYSTNTAFSYITESTGNACLTNPLSSPSCAGYQEAYLAQQCSISPLYSPQCSGYAQAYLDQQCSINQLYSEQCPNYYQAYYDNQCLLDPLYDSGCAGYQEAYALKNIVVTQPVVPQLTISSTGSISFEAPLIADPVVNEVVTRPATVAVTSTRVEQRTEPSESKKEDKKEEKKEERKPANQVRAAIQKQMIENAIAATAVANSEVKLYDSGLMQDAMVIQDRLYSRMLSKPLQDNARLHRQLTERSDRLHKEIENEQWRK
jgi:hypothetical protein